MEKNTIAVINGPNLNLLGSREPQVYGSRGFDDFLPELKLIYPHLSYHQSNVEGEIINLLHDAAKNCRGVILNPGGYAHTSVAIADAIGAIDIPVVEVHISNVYAREEYRHVMITASKCAGIVTGMGLSGYKTALYYLLNFAESKRV
ncbi:MAG: type II 3-dehydroquinate dehydratase [Bacteroidota bacterium]